MPKLILSIPQPSVARNVAFFGVVHINGATPNSTITVQLRQVFGNGNWSGNATAKADAHGNANASFTDITLEGVVGGIDNAALVATASNVEADQFSPDSESVTVV